MRATSLARAGNTRSSAIAWRQRLLRTVIGHSTPCTLVAVLILSRCASRTHSLALGDTFDILTAAGGITGDLMLGDLPDLDDSLTWHLSSDFYTLTLSVVLAGDFNGDQSVDLADYVVWRNMQGGRGAYLAADASGPLGGPDRVVDQWDYDAWKVNFGASAADFAAGRANAVPEPNSHALLLLASLASCFAARSWRR